MNNIKLVFICGPYRAKTAWKREQNVRKAEDKAAEIARAGMFPVCPHSNTRPYFESIQDDGFWLDGTLELMRRCDAIALVDGWKNSIGALTELNEGLYLKKEIIGEKQ